MTELVADDALIAARIREFDPSGKIVQIAAKVGKLIDARINEVGDAAIEKLLELNPDLVRSPSDLAKLRAAARSYYPEMLNNFSSSAWSAWPRDHMRTVISDADYFEGPSIRQHVIALNSAFDKIRELVRDAIEDAEERSELLAGMRTVLLMNVEMLYSIFADAVLANHRAQRNNERHVFSDLMTDQIDTAAKLGERLRDQAREASTATRGMLDKASEVAAAAEQSAIAMREAAHTSSGLIRAIEEARSEVDQAADVALRASQQAGEAVAMSTALSDHAQSIESILGLIRDIAGQTNLLALNATIEAARAGDAGRGFAVVAQEVKSLASQTARATDDIAQKIASIQNATRQSVDTNDRIRTTVQEVQSVGLRIRSAMDAQSQTVTMITAAVDETALAADSMSANISAIRQDTEIVASEIDELEVGISEVQNHLGGLRTKSENFVESVGSSEKARSAA